MNQLLRDRRTAGRDLATLLEDLRERDDLLVLGLPRGGVPVAYEVAVALRAPLDICVVRKLGVPGYEELAMGAIAAGDTRVLNDDVIAAARIRPAVVDEVAIDAGRDLQARERRYRGTLPALEMRDCAVILVDDGLATGSTMRAAVTAVALRRPRHIVIAVPVAAADVYRSFDGLVDRVACGMTPEPFRAVGLWYQDFPQTTDEEVRALLAEAARRADVVPVAHRFTTP